MSGVGSSPALATCETSQVLLAGLPGGFSRGSPVFAPPTDWPISYELERDVKLNKKNNIIILSLIIHILPSFVVHENEMAQAFIWGQNLSLCMIKPTIWVYDQVQHKPGCTVTEDG